MNLLVGVARGLSTPTGTDACYRQINRGAVPRRPREVTGKRLGILGLGRIRRAVAQRAQWWIQLRYHNRRPVTSSEPRLNPRQLAQWSRFSRRHLTRRRRRQGLVSEADAARARPWELPRQRRAAAWSKERKQYARRCNRARSARPELSTPTGQTLPPALIALENAVLLPHMASNRNATSDGRSRVRERAVVRRARQAEDASSGLRSKRCRTRHGLGARPTPAPPRRRRSSAGNVEMTRNAVDSQAEDRVGHDERREHHGFYRCRTRIVGQQPAGTMSCHRRRDEADLHHDDSSDRTR